MKIKYAVRVFTLALAAAFAVFSQTTTGDILGTIQDASGAVVPGAKVTVRNLATNQAQSTVSSDTGSFRVPLLPAGSYEVLVERPGFARYRQAPIVLSINEKADLNVSLTVSTSNEIVDVSADAPLVNTTNAEVSTTFDTQRVADLPLSSNRNILNLAASVPGVAQVSNGNSGFVKSGNQGTESVNLDYSVNGMRVRSNSYLIDGQDSYYPSTGGLLQPLNNPDIIAEVRFITNQFLAEFGRTAGSVMSIVTRSGTNSPHGSAFWFHNDNHLNALSNTDKLVKPAPTGALFRVENQFGGTFGERIIKDKTFVFGSLLRWTDRRLGSGSTISGAPTDEGRQALQAAGGNIPTVQALLQNLPAGIANGQSRVVVVNGRSITVPLGNITGSGSQKFDDWQYSLKGDHRFNEKEALSVRYMNDNGTSGGTGQLTPSGLTNLVPAKTQSATANLVSTFSSRAFNEFRASYSRYYTSTSPADPAVAERIPSLEVQDLGLTGFNSGTSRTGIGLAANLPQFATLNNYQIQDSFSILRGRHSIKFGIDMRRQEQFQFFLAQVRGLLRYATLQNLIDDSAIAATINFPLKGGDLITYMRYYDYFAFVQDEFRVNSKFTLTYGLRYETPGDPNQNLLNLSKRISASYGNDPKYILSPISSRDTNNFAPRVGFSWRLGEGSGPLHWLTGDSKLVLRGGYSRTYDTAFNNITLNVFNSFPLLASYSVPTDSTGRSPSAFTAIQSIVAGNLPNISNTNLLTRTIVNSQFRSPFAEQFTMQFQRELRGGFALSTGWVGTKGTALFASIDGNPTVPNPNGPRSVRVDPAHGIIRERCNCSSSIYHSWQTSLEKRLARNFSMAAHYTWSSFIDGASEIFNASSSSDIAISANPFDRRSERARSTYDRPQRLSVNGVWELPFLRSQAGVLGRILGGWQVNGFLTFQSGSPYSVLNGSDPGNVMAANPVGNAVRPNLNTSLDLSTMTVREIQAAGGKALFSGVTAANPIGNAGRNILRANGINRLDLGLVKNFKIFEGHKLQYQANLFNATNTRDWGIPEGNFASPAFLNEGANEAPGRKIQMGLRYSF